MPRYQVTAPDGRVVTLEGDTPPTDADLDQIFASLPEKTAEKPASQPEAKPQGAPTETFGKMMLDVPMGFLKEAPLIAQRAAAMPGDIISGALSLIADRMGPDVQAADILANEQRNKLRGIVEAPFKQAPDEGRGGKLGRIAAKATPTLGLAALTGGASLPAQGAILGGASAAQSGSEGGGLKEMAVSGALGAASPYVGPALAKTLGVPASALKNLAVKQYERALGATKDATKAEAARITPELLERGVSGSLKGLSEKATAQVQDVGKAIQAEYRAATQAGTKISGTQLADGLEKLKVPFREIGQGGQEVILNPKAVGAIDEMQTILRELGDASPSSIWKFRKTVDDIVSASNGFTRELPGGTARSLQKQVRGILQEELNRSVPDVARLNGEFRLWKGLQDVTAATIKRRTSQEGSLIPAILGGSIGGGVAATGSFGGAGGAALLTAGLVRAVRSPLWRTVSAVQKNNLAEILSGGSEALNSEAGRKALTMLALFGASTGNAPSEQTSPGIAR